ncbi:hypothetical protein RJ55_01272 [Drechmeria coniospora]|nr:hypothetical protein RJ55_01272 [Drechmeria coniospora]
MKLAPAATLLLAGAASAAKDRRTFAVLRFNNKQLTKGRMDPIVNPGQVSPHVHSVLGGSGFALGSTGGDLVRSNCSTAMIKGDNSNYWFPSLYFKDPKTGRFEDVDIFYANAYYFFEPTNDDIKAFPLGLAMVSGDVNSRTPPAGGAQANLTVNPVRWTCPRLNNNFEPPSWPAGSDGKMAGMGDPINKGEGVGFPSMECDGFASPLRADIHFPSCYDPEAGLTAYKKNTVFPSEAGGGKMDCPKGHVHLPHLFLEVYWNTPAFKDRWQAGTGKQPFVLSNGDATGYSLHGDFMAGWDEKLLQHIIDTCDVGTAGMDKCPGLFHGLNKDEGCTTKPATDEKVDGVLDALPGKNPLTGWAYGGGDIQPPLDEAGTQPKVSSTAGRREGGRNSPAASSTHHDADNQVALPAKMAASPSQPLSSHVEAASSGTTPCRDEVVIAWKTETVEQDMPEATMEPAKGRRHMMNHIKRHRLGNPQ